MEEIWKNIKGYEELYQISNLGQIKVKGNDKSKKEREKKCWVNNDGYLITNLSKHDKKSQYLLHRLIAIHFLDKTNFKYLPDEDKKSINLDELTVNHIDGNKLNNKIDNLEWCTNRYNISHYNNTSAKKPQKISYKRKLLEIKKYIKNSKEINDETKKDLLKLFY